MTKQDAVKEIVSMKLPREFALITFTDQKDIYFQYFGSAHLDLTKFVNFNFNLFNIKSVEKIERSTINPDCVIVYIK